MPVFERFTKDVGYAATSLSNYIANGFKSTRVLVYPHFPSRGSTLYKISKKLKLNISNKPASADVLAVYWEYLTFREEFTFLEEYAAKVPVVNLHSRNISKLFVDEVFTHAFGYGTIVNPLSFTGKIVRKNDINAKHDGVILDGPLAESKPDFIYQILIDNSNGAVVQDIRVPIIKGVMDFVYLKQRPITERFLNTATKSELKSTTDLLSAYEIEKLNTFCAELKLDFGELDVLRDKQTGKIYVVDVNNTPQGPPANIAQTQGEEAIERLAKAFKEKFM